MKLVQCNKCNPGLFRNDGVCVNQCSQGQHLSSNGVDCLNCYGCKECLQDSTNLCKSCNEGQYLLDIQTCENCGIALSNCLKCSDYQTCQECQYGYLLKKNTEGITECRDCIPGYLYIGNQCLKCGESVLSGYNSDCTEKCGDGKRVIPTTECDDGNNINGDGCSSECKIESGYTCKGGSQLQKDECTKNQEENPNPISKDKKDVQFSLKVDEYFDKQSTKAILLFSRQIKPPTSEIQIKVSIQDISESSYSYQLEFDTLNNNFFISFTKVTFQTTSMKPLVVLIQTQITDEAGNSLSNNQVTGEFPKTLNISEEEKKQADIAKEVGETIVNAMLTSSIFIILAGNFYLLVNIIDIAEIIYSLIFINTKYPFNLLIFFRIFKNFQLSFLPDFFKLVKYQDDSESPSRFAEEGMGSYYLSNTGESFTCISIVLGLYILTVIGGLKFRALFKLRKSFELNKFLDAFWTVYLNIIISSFLQFKNVKANGAKDTFNIILCVLSFVFFICSPIYLNYIVLKKNISTDEKLIQKYGTLWEGLHIESKVGRSFNIILYYRKIYFAFMIVFLHDYPNVQIAMLCLHNFVLANIVLIKRPAIHSKENFKNFLSEVLLFSGEILIYYMHNMKEDEKGDENNEKTMFGWLIIALLSTILLIHFICILIDVFQIVKKFIQDYKMKKLKNKIGAEEKINEEIPQTKKSKLLDESQSQPISNFKRYTVSKNGKIGLQQIRQQPSNGINSLTAIGSDQLLQTKSTNELILKRIDLHKSDNKIQEEEIVGRESGELSRILQSNYECRKRGNSIHSPLNIGVGVSEIEQKQFNDNEENFDIISLKHVNSMNGNNIQNKNQNTTSKNNFINHEIKSNCNNSIKISDSYNQSHNQQIISPHDSMVIQDSKLKMSEGSKPSPICRSMKNSMFTRGKQKKLTLHIDKVQKSLACLELQGQEDMESQCFNKRMDNNDENQSPYPSNNSSQVINNKKKNLPRIMINNTSPRSQAILPQLNGESESFSTNINSSRTNFELLSPERIQRSQLLVSPFSEKLSKQEQNN